LSLLFWASASASSLLSRFFLALRVWDEGEEVGRLFLLA
jgi:hypothetical protein